MNIVKTGDGRFIEVQGTAEALPFGRDALDTLLDLADHGIRAAHREAARHRRPPDQESPSVSQNSCAAGSTTPVGPMMALASDAGAVRARVLETADGCRGSTPGSRRWFAPFEIEDGTNAVIAQTARVARRLLRGAAPEDRSTRDARRPVRAARLGGAAPDPVGATTSYGAIARQIGEPDASRAVGMANGANPIAIIVPCHRVIGSNGTLTGYGGGLERKKWLLDHERGQRALTELSRNSRQLVRKLGRGG